MKRLLAGMRTLLTRSGFFVVASSCRESEKPYREGAESAKELLWRALGLCGKTIRFATTTSKQSLRENVTGVTKST